MFIDRSHTFPGRRVLTCPPVAELLPGRLPRPPGRLDGLAGQLGLPIGEIGNQLVKRNALRCAGAVLDCHLSSITTSQIPLGIYELPDDEDVLD